MNLKVLPYSIGRKAIRDGDVLLVFASEKYDPADYIRYMGFFFCAGRLR